MPAAFYGKPQEGRGRKLTDRSVVNNVVSDTACGSVCGSKCAFVAQSSKTAEAYTRVFRQKMGNLRLYSCISVFFQQHMDLDIVRQPELAGFF